MLQQSYQDTIDYLYTQLPMYQRDGSSAFKKDLTNTKKLCQLLSNPQDELKTIHIAGTNGKGSVAHIIAAILQSSGYKTGLYTSPHYKVYRERIKINGDYINKAYVIDFVKKYKEAFNEIKPSFFEITVAMAFKYFADQKVDVAVIETGLGGRLDSTNVITPLLSVITNISLDHQQFLGNTLPEIAGEKAGIIKQNVPVIIGESQPETDQVFIDKAKENQSEIIFADQKYKAQMIDQGGEHQIITINGEKYVTDLIGQYQLKNLQTAVAAIDKLNNHFSITKLTIKKGFKNVKKSTSFKGRWQILSHKPLVIADVAHNEAGIKEVLKQLTQISYKKLHFVLGMVSDKDQNAVLSILPKEAIYYFCKPNIPRGLDAEKLAKYSLSYNLNGKVYNSVNQSYMSAIDNANEDDLVLVSGSSFVVAEVI